MKAVQAATATDLVVIRVGTATKEAGMLTMKITMM